MSLDIGSALKQGAQRTFKKNGLIIAGLLFLGTLLNMVFTNSLIKELGSLSSLPQSASQVPLSLSLPVPVSGILVLLTTVASVIVSITAVRTFVSEKTDTIPSEFYRRNLGLAILNLIAGGIVFAIALALGFIAFIIPGIFLLVSLYFWNVFVIVEDENFIEAFKSSWSLTEGERLGLFGLGVIVLIVSFVVGFVSAFTTLVLGQSIGLVIQQLANSILSAFSVATLAQAYNQLQQ